jgi:hypothetical protein
MRWLTPATSTAAAMSVVGAAMVSMRRSSADPAAQAWSE